MIVDDKQQNSTSDLMELFSTKAELCEALRRSLVDVDGRKIINHPLVIEPLYVAELNHYYNKQLEARQSIVDKARKNRAWSRYIWIHERPYRLTALLQIRKHLTPRQFYRCFGEVWTDSENLWQMDDDIHKILLEKDFDTKAFCRSASNWKLLQSLPDVVTVYRGTDIAGRGRRGFSWSLAPSIAYFFAKRHTRPGNYKEVYVDHVLKQDIRGLFMDRGEFEVVVRPKNPEPLRLEGVDEFQPWILQMRNEIRKHLGIEFKSVHHGLKHAERVWYFGRRLAAKTGADLQVVECFAAWHDAARLNDNEDPEHGPRAALALEHLAMTCRYNFAANVTLPQLDKIVHAMKHHTVGVKSQDATVGTCWDADRYDLPRVKIWPDAKYLSTEAARSNLWSLE